MSILRGLDYLIKIFKIKGLDKMSEKYLSMTTVIKYL